MGYTQEFLDAFARAQSIWITSAKDPDIFHPHSRITRQEWAKFLVVFADKNLCLQKQNDQCDFEDNQKISASLSAYVRKSCEYGIIKGVNGNFHPTTLMSKAQVLVTLVRSLTWTLNELENPWYKEYHVYALGAGITTVDELESFEKVASRLEALVMLYRAKNVFRCM